MALNTVDRVVPNELERRAILAKQAEKNQAAKKAEYLEQNPLNPQQEISIYSASKKTFKDRQKEIAELKIKEKAQEGIMNLNINFLDDHPSFFPDFVSNYPKSQLQPPQNTTQTQQLTKEDKVRLKTALEQKQLDFILDYYERLYASIYWDSLQNHPFFLANNSKSFQLIPPKIAPVYPDLNQELAGTGFSKYKKFILEALDEINNESGSALKAYSDKNNAKSLLEFRKKFNLVDKVQAKIKAEKLELELQESEEIVEVTENKISDKEQQQTLESENQQVKIDPEVNIEEVEPTPSPVDSTSIEQSTPILQNQEAKADETDIDAKNATIETEFSEVKTPFVVMQFHKLKKKLPKLEMGGFKDLANLNSIIWPTLGLSISAFIFGWVGQSIHETLITRDANQQTFRALENQGDKIIKVQVMLHFLGYLEKIETIIPADQEFNQDPKYFKYTPAMIKVLNQLQKQYKLDNIEQTIEKLKQEVRQAEVFLKKAGFLKKIKGQGFITSELDSALTEARLQYFTSPSSNTSAIKNVTFNQILNDLKAGKLIKK